jgi:hypothetical protein
MHWGAIPNPVIFRSKYSPSGMNERGRVPQRFQDRRGVSPFSALAISLAIASCSSSGGGSDGTGGASGKGGSNGGVAGTTGSGGASSGSAGSNGTTGAAGATGTGGASGGAGTTGVAGSTATAGTSGGGGGAGSGGSAGTTGAAGNAGSGGRGGTTGTAGASGTGGASGSAGRGGTTGSAGSGGATGSAGRGGGSGTGGTTGTGGSGTGGSVSGPLPAFPGADGAAARITGGRGGAVYHVTRLDTDFNDTAMGTLRYGLTMLTGPRTIVFDVSGVISLGRPAVSGWTANGNGWDTQSRLNIPADTTIAGQTAPGPVIIMGGTVKPSGNNIIIRNVTFAPGYGSRSFDEPGKPAVAGDFPDAYTYDALDISGTNVMIDHVTAIYGTDETVSMNELANNITVQFCTIAQGQNYPQADAEASTLTYTGHALGSLFQAGSNAHVSIVHNLYAHLKGRLPRVGTETSKLTVSGVGAFNDFRNNVFYNWLGTAGTGAGSQPSQNNFIGNFYLAGPGGDNPSGGTSTDVTASSGGTSIFNGSDATNTKVYQSGNLKDTNKDGDASDGAALANSDFGSSSFQGSAYTQTPYYGATDDANTAFMRVTDYAGARWWSRAAVDARLISETRVGTGKIVAWADDPFNSSASEGTEWRSLVATPMVARPAGFDTDQDGMPDAWETAHGFNPSVADDKGDADGDGYTNLEEYLNEVAAWPATAELLFEETRSVRYAEIQNWRVRGGPATAIWQPSRYDTAVIARGTAVVDAAGQQAGTLRIASTLAVRRGWLEVARLMKSRAAARFELTGGTLHAEAVDFDLTNDGGTLAPGRRARGGRMTIAANVTINRGTLAIGLAGKVGDAVDVAGVARLGGALKVTARDGFAPRQGDAWTIVRARRGVVGNFTSVTPGYRVTVAGDRVVLTYGAPRRS